MLKTTAFVSMVSALAFGAWCGIGCSDSAATPAPTTPVADVGPVVDAEDASDASAPTVPDTPVGNQLAWLLAELNGQALTDPSTAVQAHFDPAFLAAVSLPQLAALLKSYVPRAAFTLVAFDGAPSPRSLVAVVRDAKGAYMRIALDVTSASTGLIVGLLFSSAGDLDPTLDSWAKVETRLKGTAPVVDYMAAEITDGTCGKKLHGLDTNVARPLGSTFKLYVLGTLARQVEAGATTWETPLAVRADYKSLPSGTTQSEANGTTHPLRYYAEKMISISDNTATDHLLYTLGRENVEASLPLMGHTTPALNVPFLATRELFFLKLVATPTEVTDYLAGDAAARRTLLDTKYKPMDIATAAAGAGTWKTPRNVDRLEWFASAEDLCRAMTTLRSMADKPSGAPVLPVLSINPGIPLDKKTWPFIGFKGGSEPGVMVLTWLLRRNDNRWFFVTTSFEDTTRAIDEEAVLYVASAATALVGREP